MNRGYSSARQLSDVVGENTPFKRQRSNSCVSSSILSSKGDGSSDDEFFDAVDHFD